MRLWTSLTFIFNYKHIQYVVILWLFYGDNSKPCHINAINSKNLSFTLAHGILNYVQHNMSVWKTCKHNRESNLQPAWRQSQTLTSKPRCDKSRDTPTALQADWATPSVINITTLRTMVNDQDLILSQPSSTVALYVTSYLSDSDKKSYEKLATATGNQTCDQHDASRRR